MFSKGGITEMGSLWVAVGCPRVKLMMFIAMNGVRLESIYIC